MGEMKRGKKGVRRVERCDRCGAEANATDMSVSRGETVCPACRAPVRSSPDERREHKREYHRDYDRRRRDDAPASTNAGAQERLHQRAVEESKGERDAAGEGEA